MKNNNNNNKENNELSISQQIFERLRDQNIDISEIQNKTIKKFSKCSSTLWIVFTDGTFIRFITDDCIDPEDRALLQEEKLQEYCLYSFSYILAKLGLITSEEKEQLDQECKQARDKWNEERDRKEFERLKEKYGE